jgi:hypothetical protein
VSSTYSRETNKVEQTRRNLIASRIAARIKSCSKGVGKAWFVICSFVWHSIGKEIPVKRYTGVAMERAFNKAFTTSLASTNVAQPNNQVPKSEEADMELADKILLWYNEKDYFR